MNIIDYRNERSNLTCFHITRREFNDYILAKQIERNDSEKIESLAFRSSNPCTCTSCFPSRSMALPDYSLSTDRCLSDRTRKHYFHPSQPSTSGLISTMQWKETFHISRGLKSDNQIVFIIPFRIHILFRFSSYKKITKWWKFNLNIVLWCIHITLKYTVFYLPPFNKIYDK